MAQGVDLEANLAIASLQEPAQQTALVPQKPILSKGTASIKGTVKSIGAQK